jgi:rhamnulokinase
MNETSPLRGYAAVDLGASGGRVILGVVAPDAVAIEEVHRFPNGAVPHGVLPDGAVHNAAAEREGVLVWDLETLFDETLTGLAAAGRRCAELGASFAGIGVDSWGVDWSYLRTDGTLELPARAYRGAPDPQPVIAARTLTAQEVYRRSGIIDHPINSALRMAADRASGILDEKTPLFTPDVWVYRLTGGAGTGGVDAGGRGADRTGNGSVGSGGAGSGVVGTDPTIASTSQLLDVHTGEFSSELLAAVGLAGVPMPPIDPVGTPVGATSPAVTERLGLTRPVPVLRVAGHDTACAFAFANPEDDAGDALISSGTWSLVGTVQPVPSTTAAARRVRFTNERGVSGVLVLRNLTGLWMVQECARDWQRQGGPALADLFVAAESLPFDDRTFDIADDRLFDAGGMEARVRALCAEVGRALDGSPLAVVHAVIDSIAAGYAESIRATAAVTGATFERIRLVGGGSRNAALCRRTAQLTGLPVVAGPVEATAIGNLAIQAAADGAVESIRGFYRLLGPAEATRTFDPKEAA